MPEPAQGLMMHSIEIFVLGLAALLLWIQIRRGTTWQKRKASQDLLYDLTHGDFYKIRRKLEVSFEVDIHDTTQNYSNCTEGMSQEKRAHLDFELKAIYNYFDAIAIGLKTNVLQEDICYFCARVVARSFFRWGADYVGRIRDIDPTIWIDAVAMVDRWNAWMERDKIASEKERQEHNGYPPKRRRKHLRHR